MGVQFLLDARQAFHPLLRRYAFVLNDLIVQGQPRAYLPQSGGHGVVNGGVSGQAGGLLQRGYDDARIVANIAFIRRQFPSDDFYQCRFTFTITPQQPYPLSAVQAKAGAVKQFVIAERDREVFDRSRATP